MKALILYDSEGGNTEKMARAIAEGAASAGASVEVRKVGEAFPLSMVANFDAVFIGSPVIYADVTDRMRSFMEHLKRLIEDGRADVKGRLAAIFGSYGFDGAWIMEERMRKMAAGLGFNVYEKVCVEPADAVKYRPERALENCRKFGKEVVESLRR